MNLAEIRSLHAMTSNPTREDKLFGAMRISQQAKRLAERYGYLPYMVERYIDLFGAKEAEEFLRACNRPLVKSIRCNDYLVRCDELKALLEGKGFVLKEIGWAPHGFWVLNEPFSLGATPEYLKGYYYIQRAASMLPAYALQPKVGELVMDMTAAPGGKTTQIAQLMKNTGVVVAVEISRSRIKALRSHVNRMGFTNVLIIRADVSRLRGFRERFSRTLLDAPCSGEGIIPVDPSRKRSRTLQDLRVMYRRQVELLKLAIELTARGGYIVYSTCSIAPEENELVIDTVLDSEVGESVDVVEAGVGVGDSGLEEFRGVSFDERLRKCRRLYPHKHGTEGFFLCKLRKL